MEQRWVAQPVGREVARRRRCPGKAGSLLGNTVMRTKGLRLRLDALEKPPGLLGSAAHLYTYVFDTPSRMRVKA